MEQKLFIELYNFVGDMSTLLSNLSEKNFKSAEIAGVVEGMEKLYNIVEREGLRRLELIKVDKTPDDYHDSGDNRFTAPVTGSHRESNLAEPGIKVNFTRNSLGNIEACFLEEMYKDWEQDEDDFY